jgi:biopolymer transport protein ExbD
MPSPPSNKGAPTPTPPSASPPKKKRRGHHTRIHKRRTGHVGAGGVRSEINVTPLVDVVLVLLIIFMVVTPMLHRGVKIDLPETVHHDKKQDSGELLVVSVRGDGTYIETDRLEGDLLDARLRQELKITSRPVLVRADKAMRYGDVRKVLERVHGAGAVSVSLATDEHKE